MSTPETRTITVHVTYKVTKGIIDAMLHEDIVEHLVADHDAVIEAHVVDPW